MRILWLKTELLHPLDKGGRIRTYYMLRELNRNHEIVYLTLHDGEGTADGATDYCSELIRIPLERTEKFSARFYWEVILNLPSPLPYFMSKYRSPRMREAIARRIRRGGVDLVVCDFLNPAVNLPPTVPCPILLFQHNVEATIWKRHFETERNPLKKAYLGLEWLKTRRSERRVCRRVDKVVAVSDADARRMEEEYGVADVASVPTGVDTTYYRPDPTVETSSNEIVFTGSMDWLPNQDAIEHFVSNILPRVQERIPDVRLTVVGRNPSPSLLRMARENSAVQVTGQVDDVRPYVNRAALFVVPIRIGGGTRLKVFEAMSMAKPIVSTPVGVEGLPVSNGDRLRIARTASEFADSVVDLLSDPDEARRLGSRARDFVVESFDWGPVAERFADLCIETTR